MKSKWRWRNGAVRMTLLERRSLFLFQKCSLSLREFADYIYYTSIRYTRRVGLVFGGLYFFKEGISASDSWLVFSTRWAFVILSVSPGFDLVGAEDSLKPLIYYVERLLRFRERQKEEGVDIPFIFHAGETLGDGTEADLNLYDAILLGTKRIGHG